MKGLKFIETLEITFMKKKVEKLDSINKINTIVYKTAFFNGKAKTITKSNDIEHELSMPRQEILNTIDKMGFRRFGMGHRSNRQSLHKRHPI